MIFVFKVCCVRILWILGLDLFVRIVWKWFMLFWEGCNLLFDIDLLNKCVIILFVVWGVFIFSDINIVLNSIIGIMFECVIVCVFLSCC